jgi:YfiH family protein
VLRPFELAPGVLAMITDRRGGVSAPPYDTLNLGGGVGDQPGAVAANRELVARAIGVGRLAWMRQVHGARVAEATGTAAPGPPETADAMFTRQSRIAIGVLVADCGPVLLADPVARIAGAAHAGREGMAAGVISELVSAMTAAGAEPARIHAFIGPLICGGCYEVPQPMKARISAIVPQAGCLTRAGMPGLDVRAGIEAQLAALGIGRISSDPRCTAESAELYSHRRDGRTGRFAGLVWLTRR